MIRVYGLKNCDSCRKASKYLTKHAIEHQFIDLRQDPPIPGQVRAWLAILGEEKLLNRRSTSWRQLPDEQKVPVGQLSEQHLIALLCAHPTLIKRPLFVDGPRMLTGFKTEALEQWLQVAAED